MLQKGWHSHPPPHLAQPRPLTPVPWQQATPTGYSELTITRIDSHCSRTAGHTSGEEGHIEWSLDIGVFLAQLVQVCKQREVNNGEWDIPAVGQEEREKRRTRMSEVSVGHQQTEQRKGCKHHKLAAQP